MSKNITINGNNYTNVNELKIPLTADLATYAHFPDTSGATAAAGDIRSTKTAFVDGVSVTGTLAEKSATDVTATGATVTVPAGIYDAEVEKSIANGSATPTATVSGAVVGDTSSSFPITITPKATVGTPGYIASIADGSAVTKYVQAETKTATPTTSNQSITPTAGKLLSGVTVNAVSLTGTAAASDVISGKTFYNTALTPVTGTATIPSVSLASGVLTIS